MPSLDEIRQQIRDKMGQDVGARMRPVDPTLAQSAEVVIDPGAAGGQHETTRLTFHVPHDNTMVSFGKPSGDWRADEGITLRTDNHIFLDVAEDVKTMVSLGKPSLYGRLSGFYGLAPSASSGYSMVTEGTAWSEATLSHVSISQTGDSVLYAEKKKVFVGAATTQVHVGAKDGIAIATPASVAIAAHSGVGLPAVVYGEEVGDDVADKASAAVSDGGANIAFYMDNAINAWGTVAPVLTNPETQKSNPYFIPAPPDQFFAIGLAHYNLAAGVGAVNRGGTGATIDVAAEEAANVTGGRSASVYGHLAAGVGSMGFASMFGNTAGITGILGLGLVGVAGLDLATMKSGSFAARNELTLSGNKSAKLESNKGWVGVSSKEHTQVTSLGKTHVWGGKAVTITACAGQGYGIQVDDDGVGVGMFASPQMPGRSTPMYYSLAVRDSQTLIGCGNANMVFERSGMISITGTKAYEMKVGGSKMTMKPSKILLG